MKKFTFKGVLDGFRSSVSQQARADQEIVESLRPDNFQVAKTFRHGFPFQPTALAFDPIQHLLAIGTKGGSLRLVGRPGVDSHVRHDSEAAVVQIQFLVNEGALITATADDSLHLWNFRQKRPEVVHSLKFQRERITYIHLPLQSKWLYVGTEKGNIHVVNIESFVLSGYVINWNKAIEVCRKTHPGPVIHLSDNPLDASKLLIGFETGQVVLWDLRTRTAEMRCQSAEPMRSISWHHEGKQFMCSHTDGSLTTWTVRQAPKPINLTLPHAKPNKEGKMETCKPIQKVEWKSSRTGEAYVIFSGGLTYDKAGRTPSITVIHGKTTTVLEMDNNVVDFVTLCESPWNSEFQDPYGIVVLLQNDLVVIDLLTPGYPCFENPYPMDLHESAVTCCTYLADCPSDLIPAFYSVGSRGNKRSGSQRPEFSEREWPICGGEWSPTSCSYNEIIITGHADGSIKFWDASAGTLQVLYKLKTAKVFEKPPSLSEDPFAIQLISLCPESRKLCVAGASCHVILFKFRKQESTAETCTLEIPIVYETLEEGDCSPDYEYPPRPSLAAKDWNDGELKKPPVEGGAPLRVRQGPQKKPPGFQVHIVCLTPFVNGELPGSITALSINSSYGLMTYGNESGLVIVDIVQKTCLMNCATPDLYGAADPYQRVPRSPKKGAEGCGNNKELEERCRSPSTDQILHKDSAKLLEAPIVLSSASPIASSPLKTTPLFDGDERESLTPGTGFLSNASSQAVTPDEVEEGAEPQAELQPAHGRRRSSAWKGFSLKKQLSRVDQRLKHTFSVDHKRGAVFYCASTESTPPVLSPIEGELPLETSLSCAPHADPDPETLGDKPNIPVFETVHDKETSVTKDNKTLLVRDETLSEMRTGESLDVNDELAVIEETPVLKVESITDSSPEAIEEAELAEECLIVKEVEDKEESEASKVEGRPEAPERPSRPMDLPLFDADGRPLRPPRRDGKKRSMVVVERVEKRDVRLLSVPNIKYTSHHHHHHHEPQQCKGGGEQWVYDLRDKEDITPASFGGLMKRFNKLDSSFSRSRSSSMSSLENISSEAIQCLAFADSYTKKSEPCMFPTLWVGTSLGSVLTIMINLPPPGETRITQPVVVSPCGTIFRLKGSILTMSFLDCNGALIPYSFETWRDENKDREKIKTPTKSSSNNRMSPTLSSGSGSQDQFGDRQFVVFTSEKQSRVVALPSHNCVYRQQLADVDFVVKAEIISLKDSVCLVCYSSNGHITAYSLPSLRPLIDYDFLPLTDQSFQTTKQGIVDPMLSIWGQQMFVNEDTDQIARTFCFSNRGHGLYLCSPTEVQKFTVSAEFVQSLSEMVGELFLPHDMPEAPKESFFKGLFGGGLRSLDREELFGESSGRASRSVAKHIPGPQAAIQDLDKRVTGLTSEVGRAHQLMVERGEKLGKLEDRAEKMASEAENFSHTSHSLMLKYKDKKWYQL